MLNEPVNGISWNIAGARPGIRDGLSVLFQRMRDGEALTSIVLPVRYGKSDFQFLATLIPWAHELISCGVSLSPNEFLRDQLHAQEKMVERHNRYQIQSQRPLSRTKLYTWKHNFTANGEFWVSTTIQLLHEWKDFFVQWIQDQIRRTGKPPLFFIDETHLLSVKNNWGADLIALVDAGAYVCVLTGTRFRDDKLAIPGFTLIPRTQEEAVVYKTRPHEDPDWIWVQKWAGTETFSLQQAHHETSYEQAWAENCLCRLSRRPFDIDLTRISDGEAFPPGLLSELPVTETRRVLGRVVRHPVVIDKGVRELLEWLRWMRQSHRSRSADCAAIIFTMNDETGDQESNAHARAIKAALLKVDKTLQITIATSADGSGKERIEAFVKGQGDILIVKQMAGMGLDCSRLKVALDLSATRTAAALIQRWTRIATPHNDILTGIVISLKDCLSDACFQTFIKSHGGEVTEKELEMEREWDQPKDHDPPESYVINGINETTIDDTDGRLMSHTKLPMIHALLGVFPKAISDYTLPQLADGLDTIMRAAANAGQETTATPVDSGGQQESLRAHCNNAARNIALARMKAECSGQYEQAVFQRHIIALWNAVYRRCNVPATLRAKDNTLDQITDIRLLTRICETFQEIERGAM